MLFICSFIDEETEAQASQVTCSGHTAEWDSNPDTVFMLVTIPSGSS